MEGNRKNISFPLSAICNTREKTSQYIYFIIFLKFSLKFVNPNQPLLRQIAVTESIRLCMNERQFPPHGAGGPEGLFSQIPSTNEIRCRRWLEFALSHPATLLEALHPATVNDHRRPTEHHITTHVRPKETSFPPAPVGPQKKRMICITRLCELIPKSRHAITCIPLCYLCLRLSSDPVSDSD